MFSIAYTSSQSFENVPSKICSHLIGKGPKGRIFLRPICPKITQAMAKERKNRKIKEKRRRRGEKNNYCTLSFFEKRRKRSMQRSRFQKSSWTYIYYSKFLTDVCKSINCKFLNLRNSFKKQVSRKMLDRSCYDSSRPFPSCL